MRGGPSESTVVIGDAEIQAPPIIPHCWAIVAMHPQGLDVLARKLRPGRPAVRQPDAGQDRAAGRRAR